MAHAVISPDGRYVAALWQRTDDPDLVARERVHVFERASGDEVFALDGPDVVRALAWTSPTHLLVARDGPGRASVMTVHEAPDGGAVGQRAVAHLSQHRPQVRVSRTGERALVAAPDAFDCRGDVFEVVRVLSLPSLDVEAEVDLGAVARSFGLLPHGRAQAALHPDGHVIAMVGGQRGGSSLVVVPTAEPDAAVIAREFRGVADSLAWLGPRALVLRDEGSWRGAMVVASLDDAWRVSTLRAVLPESDGVGARPLAVHPDGEHVLAITTQVRESPPADPDDDEYGDYAQDVSIVSVSTGARSELGLGPEYGWSGAACWAGGGRYTVSLTDDEGVSVRVTELATGRRRTRALAAQGEWGRQVEGDAVVLVTLQSQSGERVVTVDPAAELDGGL